MSAPSASGRSGEAAYPPALSVELSQPLAHFTLQCSFRAAAEVVVLFGASGTGKSKLLDCIAGFQRPQSGRIALGSRTLFDSAQATDMPVRHRRIGYLSQQPALFPHLSVRQNLGYGLLDLLPAERARRVDAMLGQLHIAPLANKRPAAISGGEQQRVALARVLVSEPELLLLDEPLSALDLALKSELLELLFAWQQERRRPMLYVTHDQAEAYSLARRVLFLEKGRIVADGTPREVFTAPAQREHAELSGYENLFEAHVEAVHPELGTMSCRLAGGLLLESPLADKCVGDPLRLALRAGDILVATAPPTGISARNIIEGVVENIADLAGLVELRLRCGGSSFIAHITRGAARSLALQPGQRLWLIIKTHSIQLLRD